MGILVSFAPLIVFPVISGFFSVQLGLCAALLSALIVLAFDRFSSRGEVKLLNLGTCAIFALLTLAGTLLHPVWNELWVRLAINGGLLAIVLFSLAAGRPFTLQYARAQVPKALWSAPAFLATNYTISAVWAGAFLAGVAVDFVRLFLPVVPPWADSTIGIGALVAAGCFTAWYPNHVRAKYAQTTAPPPAG